MTVMTTSLLNPNDLRSIELHKQSIFRDYAAVLDAVDSALRESVPKAGDFFKLAEGTIDLAVHACITRYLTKLALGARQVPAEDEIEVLYELQRVPNCGLCVRLRNCEIRILKAGSDGVPRANSDARRSFYSSNQFVLQLRREGESTDSQPITVLGLVVLWDIGIDQEFAGIQIACPRGERKDGTVDCYWVAPWGASEQKRVSELKALGGSGGGSDTDFAEDIRPLDNRKSQSS